MFVYRLLGIVPFYIILHKMLSHINEIKCNECLIPLFLSDWLSVMNVVCPAVCRVFGQDSGGSDEYGQQERTSKDPAQEE